MNLKDSLFVTGYNWGTSANGDGDWTPYLRFAGARFYDDLAVFKSGRGMVPMHSTIEADRLSITPPSLERPLAATGRNVDAVYERLSAQGFKVMLCPQGAFANQDLPDGASFRKHPPIDKGEDPDDVYSYEPYAQLYAQMVLRWGPDNNDQAEEVYQGSNSFFSTDPGTGRNTVWGFQAGNELNFRWHGGRILTPRQIGVMWASCYTEARQVSPNARLVSPSILSATADKLRDIFEGFKEGCEQLGIEPQWDWHPSFHRYHRKGNQGQLQVDGDEGATPEDVDSYALYKAIVDVCHEYGTLAPMLTETGWNDDPSPNAKLQRAPIQEGYSLSESKAILTIRDLILAKAAGIEVVCSYHIADDYEGSWGNGMGWYHGADGDHPDFPGAARWSPKPCVELLQQWMGRYGSADVKVRKPLVRVEQGKRIYEVRATLDGQRGFFTWSADGHHSEGVTSIGPLPEWRLLADITTPPVEPEPTTPTGLIDLGATDKGRLWFQPNQ